MPETIDYTELLGRFTLKHSCLREYLQKPWRDGQYVYASNGHWLARVPAAEFHGEAADRTPRHPASVARMFADAADRTAFHPLTGIAKPEECGPCSGRGVTRGSECNSCDGEGTFDRMGWDYECKQCDGTGIDRHVPDEAAADHACNSCKGYGLLFTSEHEPALYRERYFSPVYLWLLQAIAGAELAVAADPLAAARFRVGALEGLLMPCREPKAA